MPPHATALCPPHPFPISSLLVASMSSRATQRHYISQTPLQLAGPCEGILANGTWAQGCYNFHTWLVKTSPRFSLPLPPPTELGWILRVHRMEGAWPTLHGCVERSSASSSLHQTVP